MKRKHHKRRRLTEIRRENKHLFKLLHFTSILINAICNNAICNKTIQTFMRFLYKMKKKLTKDDVVEKN